MKNNIFFKPSIIYILTLLITSGCASRYAPPVTGPIAYITYALEEDVNSVEVINYKTSDCSGSSRIGILFNGEPDEKTIDVAIPANKPFISHFSYSWSYYGGMTACEITTSFIPEENQNYKSVFKTSYNSCSAQIFKITEVNNQTTLLSEPTFKKNPKKCHWW